MVKRKIPARKHHGIRDPLKQQAQQLDRIKDKINNPPKQNEQEKIPYSLAQIIKGKKQAKRGIVKKKYNIGVEDKPKHIRNKIKPIKRLPNEDDENYLKRINRATTQSLKEAEYEIKYGVEVHRNSKTGEVTVKKKSKESLQPPNKNNKKYKNALDPKVSKELIKQVLKEEKLEHKKELSEFKTDYIKFGEVVNAPPTFSVVPKKAEKSETVPRPGKRDLLLKSVINENTLAKKPKIKKNISPNFKGKRKNLTLAARDMIEKERFKTIELYRKLKKN
ncbi:coiled-coil domain-containing protein 137 [Condylostylus longicornis]|uniref:coiled-coil domain-containing protein 137 n=1 Tax=Condylostylus longicornis TaxID=2530218 RepID=UPI00244E0916|nr:coiled-coil domain-containing protein 137 [Condylostylus longicornis]